jgi:uncharacterized Fe-S cluster protein YjdI
MDLPQGDGGKGKKTHTRYCVSGEPEVFNQIASLIMDEECSAEKISFVQKEK